jgi:hypothetical protein
MEQQFSLALSGFLHDLLEWAAALQTADYLLLFASLLGLAAVYLFVRGDRTERYQIEREFQERAAEREIALRAEIYLPAADAIARAQSFLGKFPAMMDLAREEVHAVIDDVLGALGKAQLVASETSVRPVMAVASEFTNGYLALTARRQQLAKLKAEIAGLDSAVSNLAVERDHLLASITRIVADSTADKNDMWRELNQRFDKLHREIGSLLGQRKDRLVQRTALEHEFVLEAQQCALRLIKLGVPAYLALRSELQLAIDEKQYREMAQQSIAEIERNLKALADAGKERTPAHRAASLASRQELTIQPLDLPRDAQQKAALKRSVLSGRRLAV